MVLKHWMAAALLAASACAPAAHAAEDAATLAASRDLLAAMDFRGTLQRSLQQAVATAPQMIQQSGAATINANASLSAEQREAALQKLQADMPRVKAAMAAFLSDSSLLDELVRETAPLYARHFTLNEIKQVTAFYRTPVGAKMLKQMPALMQESMAISQRLLMPRLQRFIQEQQQQATK